MNTTLTWACDEENHVVRRTLELQLEKAGGPEEGRTDGEGTVLGKAWGRKNSARERQERLKANRRSETDP